MAKKKLSDYQKARREFVQRRATGMGGDVTKEQRQQFRQRFDVLASTKQGRTQLAQRALPTGGPEERRDYKRMLATELPARGSTNNGPTGPTGPTTKVPTYADYAERLTAAQSKLSNRYTTPVTSPGSKSTNVRGGVGSAQYGPQYAPSKSNVQKAQDIFSNRRNNVIGKGIDFPGRAALDRITNPLGGTGKVEFTAKGVGKAALQELGEAVLIAGPAARGSAAVLGGTKKVLQYGVKKFGQAFFQQAKNTKTPTTKTPTTKPSAPKPPKPSGAKTPGRKLPSTKTPTTKTPTTKTPTSKTPTTKTSTSKTPGRKLPSTKTPSTKTSSTKAPDVKKIEAEFGEVKWAEPAPVKTPTTKTPSTKTPTTKTPSTKTPSTKTPSTKTPGRKLPDTKPAAAKEKPLSKAAAKKAEDTKLTLGMKQAKYPKATEKDLDFIRRIETAQDIVENQKQNWYQYSQWLQSSQTQAKLRALRGK